jgi:hypothetical protein
MRAHLTDVSVRALKHTDKQLKVLGHEVPRALAAASQASDEGRGSAAASPLGGGLARPMFGERGDGLG